MALLGVNLLIYYAFLAMLLLWLLSHCLPACGFNLGKLWQSQITSELLVPRSSPGWPLLPASSFPVFSVLHVVFVVFFCGGELNAELVQSAFLSSGVIFLSSVRLMCYLLSGIEWGMHLGKGGWSRGGPKRALSCQPVRSKSDFPRFREYKRNLQLEWPYL